MGHAMDLCRNESNKSFFFQEAEKSLAFYRNVNEKSTPKELDQIQFEMKKIKDTFNLANKNCQSDMSKKNNFSKGASFINEKSLDTKLLFF